MSPLIPSHSLPVHRFAASRFGVTCGLVSVAAVAMLLAGCNSYPVVSSGEHIELIAALRTACSSQRTDRLDRTVKAIEERRSAGDLQDAEYAAMQEIVALARAGKWQEAEQETYRFQQAQVR